MVWQHGADGGAGRQVVGGRASNDIGGRVGSSPPRAGIECNMNQGRAGPLQT